MVLPTCNRLELLNRMPHSIIEKSHLAKEIITVNKSDFPLKNHQFLNAFDGRSLQIIHSKPWVYERRNMAYVFGFLAHIEINIWQFYKNYFIQKFAKCYTKWRNYISKSVWRIITNFKGVVFKTDITKLSASFTKSENLKKTQFDTAFYKNEINSNKSCFFRINALQYIPKKNKRFGSTNRLFLVWSLIGNFLIFLLKGKIKVLANDFTMICRIIFNFPLYKLKH